MLLFLLVAATENFALRSFGSQRAAVTIKKHFSWSSLGKCRFLFCFFYFMVAITIVVIKYCMNCFIFYVLFTPKHACYCLHSAIVPNENKSSLQSLHDRREPPVTIPRAEIRLVPLSQEGYTFSYSNLIIFHHCALSPYLRGNN